MFTSIISHQYVADRIKGFVLGAETSKSTQHLMLHTIKEFEALPWIPLAFEDAHKAAAPMLKISKDITITYEGGVEDALISLDSMLRKYAALIHTETAKLAEFAKKLKEYTADEAAEVLGVSRATFDTYTSRRKLITGRKVGTSVLYNQAEIDRLREMRKPLGRPQGAKNKPKPAETT